MNKFAFLGTLALASCVGMALGYGKMMTMNNKFNTGHQFMATAQPFGYGGYMPQMGNPGFGGFMGGTGGSGMGGMFGSIIQLFIFIFVINLLFSSTGIASGGLGGIGGVGGGRKHVGTNYDHNNDFY